MPDRETEIGPVREQQRQQVGAAIRGGRMASCATFVVGVVDARIRSHERFDNRRRVERPRAGGER